MTPAPSSQPSADGIRRLRPLTVLKLGGSLARDGAHVALLKTITKLTEAGHLLVIVPGGGEFADVVRQQCEAAATSPTAAHWMAILAMDQMAYLLAEWTRSAGRAPGTSVARQNPYPRPNVVRGAAGIARAFERRRVPILAPFRWLREANPLPHTWDVTSDSIAAWIAAQLDARRLILLKSVNGVYESEALLQAVARTAIETATDRGSRLVDAYFTRALAAVTECWIINGRRPERLRELFAHDTTIGTVVY